ncbi:hypothetical protein LCGC14_1369410 [marine sediment metagenome]|uniref:Uncharacterized protein n=1 Tax=marine sediment metagenome TaxID=412755 RepID=A0A0F9N7R3_9ZZZZ
MTNLMKVKMASLELASRVRDSLYKEYLIAEREKLAKVLAWQTLGRSYEMEFWDEEKVWYWVVKNHFEAEYLEKADQILELLKELRR